MNSDELYVAALLEKGSREKPNDWVPQALGMGGLSTCARWAFINLHRPAEICGIEVTFPVEEMMPRVSRILKLGYIIEDEIVRLFKRAGHELTGTQLKFHDFNNRLRGRCDGILDNLYIIEIKTMKTLLFQIFKSLGPKIATPSYYDQTQMYMFYAKLQKGFIVSYDKDTSEIAVKTVHFDLEHVNNLRFKASNIIKSKTIYNIKPFNRDNEDCDWCSRSEICDRLPNSL